MSRQTEITEALAAIVKATAPEIKWGINIVGSRASKEVEGTISYDRVEYRQEAQDYIVANATYSIYVIDINANADLENLSDKLFAVLYNNDFEGLIYNGVVTHVIFGTPRGDQKAAAMLMEYQVEYAM